MGSLRNPATTAVLRTLCAKALMATLAAILVGTLAACSGAGARQFAKPAEANGDTGIAPPPTDREAYHAYWNYMSSYGP